jgi:predicted helicase
VALQPNSEHTWLVSAHADEFEALLPIGTFETKQSADSDVPAVFKLYSRGVATSRDAWVYGFDRAKLIERTSRMIESYNSEVDRWKRAKKPADVDSFVIADESKIKWSRDLKLDLQRGNYANFNEQKVRIALYRPFSQKYLFLDRILNEEVYVFPRILPIGEENLVITTSDIAYRAPTFSSLISRQICDLHLCAGVDAHQCFPFYIYDEDGSHRRENITDWALEQFRADYQDRKINKWDIFYYVYGMLHHSGYREKFADNLKRELPRLPFAKDFRAFSAAGKELARLHLDYEQMKAFPLKWIESKEVPLSYRVEDKMRLSKDKKSLTVNPSLTLSGIPSEAFQYRLGNRSALEWVIDQYQVTEDHRTGIRSDPNRADDEEYIVRLVGQVIQVSLETVRIVSALPKDYSG